MTDLAEARQRFNRMAQIIGNRVFGVDLGVYIDGDRLIFVDGADDPLTIDGQDIIVASPEEIAEKYIPDFPVRALRAAGIAKYQEIERAREP